MLSTRGTGSRPTSATSRRRTAARYARSAPPRSTAARSGRSATARSPTSNSPQRKPEQGKPEPRNDAERRAARWYRLHAYRILDSNRWLGGYELDLVARRGEVVVFCEVKSKSGDRFGDPLEMVTAEKQRRIRRAAELWLACHREHDGLRVRFDVIAERAGRLEHVPDAF